MERRRLLLLAATLLCTFLEVSSAWGQPPGSFVLIVRAGSDAEKRCWHLGLLRGRVAHYREHASGDEAELRVDVELRAGNEAELQVRRGNALLARRRFSNLAPHCDDRRDAVALAIALALDNAGDVAPKSLPSLVAATGEGVVDSLGAGDQAKPDGTTQGDAVARPLADEPQAGVSPESSGAAQAVAPLSIEVAVPFQPTRVQPTAAGVAGREVPADPPDSGAAVRRTDFHVHLGGRWLASPLPSAVWMGVLGMAVRLPGHIGLELAALATSVGESRFLGQQARGQLFGGELLGCQLADFGAFGLQGCLGAVMSVCRVSGQGYGRDLVASPLWAAGTARASLEWPRATAVSLRLSLQVNASVVRPGLRVVGTPELLAPAWVGGSTGADLVIKLP